MNILYAAKHNSGHNDDEGAIAYALRQLGHTVTCVEEDPSERYKRYGTTSLDHLVKANELLLFHKGLDAESIAPLSLPKVFWYFDLVDSTDPLLASRCAARKGWMDRYTPLVDLGFCTDGDWVRRDRSGKLHLLRQGADERVVGFGIREVVKNRILYVGSVRKTGAVRRSFILEVWERYGNDFLHVEKGCHGVNLHDAISSAEIVLAPDGPITPHYWSNRIYLTLGFGGFLLHPHCGAAADYEEGQGVIYYRHRDQLHRLIEAYRAMTRARENARLAGYERTLAKHLYRHRCEELIRITRTLLRF